MLLREIVFRSLFSLNDHAVDGAAGREVAQFDPLDAMPFGPTMTFEGSCADDNTKSIVSPPMIESAIGLPLPPVTLTDATGFPAPKLHRIVGAVGVKVIASGTGAPTMLA
jgi:hypothetical protein